jgi:hypothetical protein
MSKIPTDLQILERIYADYAATFRSYSDEAQTRNNVNYVPIDVNDLASKLKTHPNELFGRLYYHLDHKYRYKQDGGGSVHLFTLAIAGDRHCIHFPYLAALLAERRTEHRRNFFSIVISIVSLMVALAALLAQFSAQPA